MKLVNFTTKELVHKNVDTAKSWQERSAGLLFKIPTQGMHFQTHWGIHTFGMGFSLTVVICDKQNTVKKIIEHLPPNRLLFWNPAWDRVYELPAGKYRIKLGDRLGMVE